MKGCTANGSKSERGEIFVGVDDGTLPVSEEEADEDMYMRTIVRVPKVQITGNRGKSLVRVSCLESPSAFIEISPTRPSTLPWDNGPEKRYTIIPRIWLNHITGPYQIKHFMQYVLASKSIKT